MLLSEEGPCASIAWRSPWRAAAAAGQEALEVAAVVAALAAVAAVAAAEVEVGFVAAAAGEAAEAGDTAAPAAAEAAAAVGAAAVAASRVLFRTPFNRSSCRRSSSSHPIPREGRLLPYRVFPPSSLYLRFLPPPLLSSSSLLFHPRQVKRRCIHIRRAKK